MPTTEKFLEVLDDTYLVLTDRFIPHIISSTYTFAKGVALVTSLTTIVTQYLAYFALQYALAFTGPIALITGIILAYLKYRDNDEKHTEMLFLINLIHFARKENFQYGKRLKAYFSQQGEKFSAEKKALSMQAGEYFHIKSITKDKRTYVSWVLELITRFIADSGLTVGVSAFILTTFTAVSFTGIPLTCIVIGGLIMASLSYFLIHRKRFNFSLKMGEYKEELKQQRDIQRFYENWFDMHSVGEMQLLGSTACWYNREALHEGYCKGMLDEIKIAINKYFVKTGLILPSEIIEGKNGKVFYSISKLNKDVLNNIKERANQKIGYTSRNLMLAIKIGSMIKFFKDDCENYTALIKTINKWRQQARHYSLLSYCYAGRSRLADSLDEIFDRADEDFSQLILIAKDFNTNQVQEFENFFKDLFVNQERIQRENIDTALII